MDLYDCGLFLSSVVFLEYKVFGLKKVKAFVNTSHFFLSTHKKIQHVRLLLLFTTLLLLRLFMFNPIFTTSAFILLVQIYHTRAFIRFVYLAIIPLVRAMYYVRMWVVRSLVVLM